MKRVFEHPPEAQTGKQYWRSIGELSDTPEFRGWLEREFPAGAAQLEGDEWSRRGFLKLMGASMALAGFGLSSCRRPEAHLVPVFEKRGVGDPGQAALLRDRDAAPNRRDCRWSSATVDGRPIKIEGNPLHPASGGATDAFAQASILDLYDPARSKRFVEQVDKESTAKTAPKRAIAQLSRNIWANFARELRRTAAPALRFSWKKPSRRRAIVCARELEKMFPQMRWCQYEPLLSEAQKLQHANRFGDNTRLVPRLRSGGRDSRARQRFPGLRRRRHRVPRAPLLRAVA